MGASRFTQNVTGPRGNGLRTLKVRRIRHNNVSHCSFWNVQTMKIEPSSSTPEPIVASRGNAPDATSTSQVHGNEVHGNEEDKTTLSYDRANISTLTSQAMSSSDVRQDRIEVLRQAISSGQYQAMPDQIAEAMLRESSK
jgi:flagellar biosynthesis anti-sigma factor FlgM